jgi:hypothetical protein
VVRRGEEEAAAAAAKAEREAALSDGEIDEDEAEEEEAFAADCDRAWSHPDELDSICAALRRAQAAGEGEAAQVARPQHWGATSSLALLVPGLPVVLLVPGS